MNSQADFEKYNIELDMFYYKMAINRLADLFSENNNHNDRLALHKLIRFLEHKYIQSKKQWKLAHGESVHL